MRTPIRLPKLSMTMQEGKILEWLVREGDTIREGQSLVTVEADKTVTDIESPADGTLSQILVPLNAEVQPGTVLAVLETADSMGRRPAPGSGAISPAARRLAREHGLDLSDISGTGPGGAVVLDDVRTQLDERTASSATPISGNVPEDRADRPAASLALDGIRGVMARRMEESHATIVQATTVADVDMSRVAELRTRASAGYTAFVVTAAAHAVSEFPLVNARLEGKRIIMHDAVHVGVAVDTPAGLVVPVIRQAERKSVTEIDGEVRALAERARDRTLTAEEQAGATMTVTNSGALGSLLFTPIVVLPQSATLGMGKIAETPVVRNGHVVVRRIMYLCLSYDHRFIDGATAVRYLQRVRSLLEDPT